MIPRRQFKGSATSLLVVATLLVLLGGMAAAQEPTQEARIATLKQSLAASMEALKHYEWTETTVISHSGDEVSRTQARCQYASDGKLAKEPIGTQTEQKEKKGLRGRKAKKKKQEIQEYMQQVEVLIHTYVPPQSDLIQKSKDAGKFSIEVVDPGKQAVLRFGDYELPGDSVGIKVDLTNNTLLGYDVATYLNSADQTVLLNVEFGTLEDGTIYPAHIVIEAKAEAMTVDIANSDYSGGN